MLRISAPFLLALFAMALTSCGRGQGSAQVDLESAMDKIDHAERGFSEQDGDHQVHRDAELNQAVPELKSVIQNGTIGQKVVANRQLALIELSSARHRTRLATVADAAFRARAASMLRLLGAVSEADVRAQLSSRDVSALLQELRSELDSQRQRSGKIQQKLAELQAALGAIEIQQQEHRQVAQEGAVLARGLKEEAFLVEGDDHYNLLSKAAETELTSSVASSAADLQEAKADMLRVAIQVDQTELDAHSHVIKDLAHRISVTEDLGRQRSASLVTARSDQTAAQTKLLAEFKEISQEYDKQVRARLAEAGGRAAQAVGLLQKADSAAQQGKATRKLVSYIQADRLSALGDQAHIVSEHIASASSRAHTVAVLHAHSHVLTPQQAAQIKTEFDGLETERQQLITDLEAIVQQSTEMSVADDLSEAQIQRLAGYLDRIKKMN